MTHPLTIAGILGIFLGVATMVGTGIIVVGTAMVVSGLIAIFYGWKFDHEGEYHPSESAKQFHGKCPACGAEYDLDFGGRPPKSCPWCHQYL